MKTKYKWGLALGGGGARGIAHVGVLKALEKANLLPDVITGTSIGALVGGAYACKPDAPALEKRFYDVLAPDSTENKPLKMIARLNWESLEESTILSRLRRSFQKELFVGMVAFRSGVLSEEELRSCVAAFLPDVDLAETRIPFAPLTVDLLSGRPHLLEKGSIVEAVMASCAVPGFMPPVRIEDAVLMDGGLAELIPAEAARTCGADTVIGVDVGIDLCDACELSDGIDAINRATEIMSHHLGNSGRKACDLLIKPLDDHVAWTDFRSYMKLIQLGEAAAEAALDDIRRIVRKKPGRKWKIFNFFSEKEPCALTHG